MIIVKYYPEAAIGRFLSIFLLSAVAAFFCFFEADAQSADSSRRAEFDYQISRQDSSFIKDSLQRHTIEEMMTEEPVPEKQNTMSKSPTNAIIYSLLFPGLGQFYVESYWKVPVFAGAAGGLYYLMFDNHNKFVDFADEADFLESEIERLQQEPEPPEDEIARMTQELDLTKQKKEFYRDNRDMSGFYLLGVYLLSAIDAYAGAHLFDFSVDDNLAIQILPIGTKGIAMSMYIRF